MTDRLSPEQWGRLVESAAGDTLPSRGQLETAVADALDTSDEAAIKRVEQAVEAGVLVEDPDAGAFGGVRVAGDAHPSDDGESNGETDDEPTHPALDVEPAAATADGWAGVAFDDPETDVWAPAQLDTGAWMLRKDSKAPWSPWADADAPVECSRDHDDLDDDGRVTCAECGHAAGYKWGSDGSREHVHADAATALQWRDRHPGVTDDLVFIQSDADPFAFVDGDDVRDPETGEVHPAFVALLEHLGLTYGDVSTSGSGVHAVFRGELPDGVKMASWPLDDEPFGSNDDLPAIEIYDGKHVCIATGQHLPGTGTRVEAWDDDALRAILDANDELPSEPAPSAADREEFDPSEHDADATTADETATDARDVFAAIDRLDARRVAEQTIVSSWNDDARTSGGNRAFAPTWGPNANGTANIVDGEKWQDTGDRGGYGGPAVMAAIDADLVDERATPRDVRGETWVKAVEHLRTLGFDVPKYVGEADDSDEYRPDPTEVDVVVEPERAYDAAKAVAPADLDDQPLPATDDGEAWSDPDTGERVGVVRAVALATGTVDAPGEPLQGDEYARMYRRAREEYGAPLPQYVGRGDTVEGAEIDVVYGAVRELRWQHLDRREFSVDVTAEGGDVSGEAVATLDPTPVDGWRDSESGASVLVFPSGTVYDADTDTAIDPLRFVALDHGLIDEPTSVLRGETFREAYRVARDQYGAPLPLWRGAYGGEPDVTPILPPADRLGEDGDGIAVDRDRLSDARRDVEDLYRELASEPDEPAVMNCLPALGKTTSAIKTARSIPTTYLAPRKELQAQAVEKAGKWGVTARVLPVFAGRGLRDDVLSAAVEHVREHGKDALRDRWTLFATAVGDDDDGVFPDEDDDGEDTELERATCPTANGEHGDDWALAVHTARALDYTPRDIHERARALFGAPLPCQHGEGERCEYSEGWDAVSDPDDPTDLLVGSYGHAHVESARTHYSRSRDGSINRQARTLVVDEYPEGAYLDRFGDAAREHATWLASALRPDVDDRDDLADVDVWGDALVRAWLRGEADESDDAVDEAVAALHRRREYLGALTAAHDVRDGYDDVLETHGLDEPVGRLLDAGAALDADEREAVARTIHARADDVAPDAAEIGIVRWLVEDVADALLHTADGTLTVDVDELPFGEELRDLTADALEASRGVTVPDGDVDGARALLEAAAAALTGGDDGARELAVWSDHGYAHRQAHQLLTAVAAPDDADGVSIHATDSFAYTAESDGTRLKRVEITDRVTVLLDRNHRGATVRSPPELVAGDGEPVPFVGLDATGRRELWSLAIGEGVNLADVHDTPRERARFLRDALGLSFIQASDQMRPYEGNPDGKDLDGDVALVESTRDAYTGVHAPRQRGEEPVAVGDPAVITTNCVQEVLEADDRLTDVAAWEHYGNLTGANDLGDHRLGVLLGSQHYGDAYVEHMAALAGETVERSGRGSTLEYGGDVANALLHHMREDQVMQAALRFARGESGATVVARTAAVRDDLPVVGRGHVVESYSPTTTAVARTARRLGEGFTVSDVVDDAGLDVTRERVRQVLADLATRGVVAKHKSGPGLADTYDRTGELGGAGTVDLPGNTTPAGPAGVGKGGDGSAPPNTPLEQYYTVNLGVVTADGLVDPGSVTPDADGTRLPAPPDAAPAGGEG